MKKTFILLLAILINNAAHSQNWAWVQAAKADSPANFYPGIVAAGSNSLIWCIQTTAVYNNGIDVMGSYVIKEYDTSGTVADSINIDGRLKLITAQCDSAGNYYVVGYYYDSAIFSGGFTIGRSTAGTAPQYFIFRLGKGTLHIDWFNLIGADNNITASYFIVNKQALYLIQNPNGPIKYVYRYDLATGDTTRVLQQSSVGFTNTELNTIAVDNNDNIYMTGGSLGPTTMIFNGDTVSSPAGLSYFGYYLRYRANGVLDWVHFLPDVTVNQRTFTCYNNNTVYYSGIIDDTLTIDGIHVHKPAWDYDYIVAQMDSTGTVNWLRQMQDTIVSNARVENMYHARVQSDGGICIYNSIGGIINWGGGITTNNALSMGNASVVSYAAGGAVNWVVTSHGNVANNGNMAFDGNNLWVTGTCQDSSRYTFGAYNLPTPGYKTASFMGKVNPNMPGTTLTKTLLPNPVSMIVYPNPAHDVLYIKPDIATGKYTLQLYNMTGSVVYRSVNQGSATATIPTAMLPRGIYMAEIADGQSRFVKKIVLE